MSLDPEPSGTERISSVPAFAREIDLSLGDQVLPKLLLGTLFSVKALVNGAVVIQQLKHLGESIGAQFSPLFVGAGRTAIVPVDRSSGLQLEIGKAVFASQLKHLGKNLGAASGGEMGVVAIILMSRRPCGRDSRKRRWDRDRRIVRRG